MTINVYDKGDVAHLTAAFEDDAGTATDPTTVSLKVLDPSGNEDTYTYAGGTITKDSTGNFSKDIDCDEEGDWHYKWISTGDAAGGEEGQFVVKPTPF